MLLSCSGDQLNDSQGVEAEVKGKHRRRDIRVSISMDRVRRHVNVINNAKCQVVVGRCRRDFN